MSSRFLALGTLVMDTVIIRQAHQNSNRSMVEYFDQRIVGGPPAFYGYIGFKISEIFSAIPPPSLYAYSCPEALVQLRAIIPETKILQNLQNSQKCPHFQLDYSNSAGKRVLSLSNPPSPFNPDNFSWHFSTSMVAILGSVYQEFNHKTMVFLRPHCRYMAFDPQGHFRRLNQEKTITFTKWYDTEILSFVDCVKLSEREAFLLGLGDTLSDIIFQLLKFPRCHHVIITRGQRGAILGVKNDHNIVTLYEIPVFLVKNIIDETGAGDVLFAAFVAYLTFLSPHPLQAIAFATSIVSFFLETPRFQSNFSQEGIVSRQKRILSRIKPRTTN